jgi:hypothetical protein
MCIGGDFTKEDKISKMRIKEVYVGICYIYLCASLDRFEFGGSNKFGFKSHIDVENLYTKKMEGNQGIPTNLKHLIENQYKSHKMSLFPILHPLELL